MRKYYKKIGLENLHRVIANAVFRKHFGKDLPPKAVVHHADGTRSESSPLVICQDQAYHFLLHARMKVKSAGGNPNTDKVCSHCGKPQPIANFRRDTSQYDGRKKTCKFCRRVTRNDGAHRRKMTPDQIREAVSTGQR